MLTHTKNGRLIIEQFSDSPVTRVRIKRDELVLRYSKDMTDERQDDIFDSIIALEVAYHRKHATVSVKILNTDDLSQLQLEMGDIGSKTVIIKHRGIDY